MVDGFIYHTRVAVNTYSGREVLGRSDAGDPLPGTSAFGRQSAFFFFQLWFFFSPSKFYSHGWRARPVRHFLNPWTRAFFLYASYAAFRWNSLAASIICRVDIRVIDLSDVADFDTITSIGWESFWKICAERKCYSKQFLLFPRWFSNILNRESFPTRWKRFP